MRTITLFNQKGGAGKTTCAMLLADGLQKAGYKVLVVDTDPQHSALKWEQKVIEGYSQFPVRVEAVSGLGPKEFAIWLSKRIDNLDYLIIDTPPNLASVELRVALFMSDIALLPLVPHGAFIDALEELVPLLKKVEAERDKALDVRVLVNKYTGRRATEREIVSGVSEISPWPVLQTQLKDYVAYADAYNYRTSVYAMSGGKEARELLNTLVEEVSNGC